MAVNIGNEWWLKQNETISSARQFQNVGNLVSIILFNVYIGAGILLFVLLLFGGISIIFGAGGGDPKKASQGQKAVFAAVTGFLIIFASYWIVQAIAYITGIEPLKNLFNLDI